MAEYINSAATQALTKIQGENPAKAEQRSTNDTSR